MQVLRYPPRTLVGDYLRAVAGMGVGVGVLVVNPASWSLAVIFGGIAGLFGLFGARTAERQIMRVGLRRDAVARAAIATRHLPWDALERVKLRYYGTRREQRNDGGFFQLKLAGAGTRMTFESNLEGFDYLVWRASRAARDNGVSVDPKTAGNMLDLGIDVDGEQAPPDDVLALARTIESGGDAPAASGEAAGPGRSA